MQNNNPTSPESTPQKEGEVLYRFVKCSERLPDHGSLLWCRTTLGRKIVTSFVKGEWDDIDLWEDKNETVLEWLEEFTPTAPAKEGEQERVEGLGGVPLRRQWQETWDLVLSWHNDPEKVEWLKKNNKGIPHPSGEDAAAPPSPITAREVEGHAPGKYPAQSPEPEKAGSCWKEYNTLSREIKDRLFSFLEPYIFLDGDGRDVVFDADAMMAMYKYAKSLSPSPTADAIEGEVPEEIELWIKQYADKEADDGPHSLRAHIYASVSTAMTAMWRKMQEQIMHERAMAKHGLELLSDRTTQLQNSLDREVDRYNAISVERYEYRAIAERIVSVFEKWNVPVEEMKNTLLKYPNQ